MLELLTSAKTEKREEWRRPAESSAPHTYNLRVYYEDTDFSGVVYHGNYLRFLDRGREEFFGVDKLRSLHAQCGLGFVVYKLTIKYCQSAGFGDELQVTTVETKRTTYRAFLEQKIFRVSDGLLLVKASVEVALVDSSKKVVRISDELQKGECHGYSHRFDECRK